MAALPEDTVLVACNSSIAKYPEGVIPTVTLGYFNRHPGFVLLSCC